MIVSLLHRVPTCPYSYYLLEHLLAPSRIRGRGVSEAATSSSAFHNTFFQRSFADTYTNTTLISNSTFATNGQRSFKSESLASSSVWRRRQLRRIRCGQGHRARGSSIKAMASFWASVTRPLYRECVKATRYALTMTHTALAAHACDMSRRRTMIRDASAIRTKISACGPRSCAATAEQLVQRQ